MDLHLNTPSQLVAKISTALQNLAEDVRFEGDLIGDPTDGPIGDPTGKSVGIQTGDLRLVVAI